MFVGASTSYIYVLYAFRGTRRVPSIKIRASRVIATHLIFELCAKELMVNVLQICECCTCTAASIDYVEVLHVFVLLYCLYCTPRICASQQG